VPRPDSELTALVVALEDALDAHAAAARECLDAFNSGRSHYLHTPPYAFTAACEEARAALHDALRPEIVHPDGLRAVAYRDGHAVMYGYAGCRMTRMVLPGVAPVAMPDDDRQAAFEAAREAFEDEQEAPDAMALAAVDRCAVGVGRDLSELDAVT
jgi:hypothetical protein